MRKECKNIEVLNMANSLLNSTENIPQNFFIRQDLENFIEDFESFGEETDYQDMLNVIVRICLDDTDIKEQGFHLEEIPHECVYTFCNNKNQWFDVYLNYFNGNKDEVTIGYVGTDHRTHDTENITDAISHYCIE